MDLKEKNSMNIDLENVRLSQEKKEKTPQETYKVISEENGFNHGNYHSIISLITFN